MDKRIDLTEKRGMDEMMWGKKLISCMMWSYVKI